ncbi:MAG: Gfo/Idh/MocA family oxidoreductase [Gemmatimonadota bacterium]|nr:Gfo/Idh/MocA family oxidoreductase [Gemmatimonadota bacterium]
MGVDRLGIGVIGSGFVARFHIQSFASVRDADVRGVWSPNEKNAASAAALAREHDVGDARSYKSIREMVSDPAINALWLCGPNQARIENIEEIVGAIKSGAGSLLGIACEKPLARNVAEARKVASLVRGVGLNTGYLENQLFAPDITRGRELIWARGAALTGRPYLARAAEEHNGPHMPWFWQGSLQGGGVLNDMMCHSVEVVRHLLTEPGAPRSSIKPRRISAHIASLKWSRPEYARRLSQSMGKDVDYTRRPSEDFARATIEYEAESGETLIGEVTTSWSFVGAGLRLSAELLGPEYSLSWNTLDSSLKIFFSRQVRAKAGEDLLEKQNAEVGLMPVVADEGSVYGYAGENRHMTRAFIRGEKPMLTFDDGVEVVELLMAAYMSAQKGQTLDFPPAGLDSFVPEVAKGSWRP